MPGVQSASLARSSPLASTGFGFAVIPPTGGESMRLNGSIV
jgi:hypothetical protein